MNRRSFIRSSVLASGVIPLLGHNYFIDKFEKKMKLSLSQWSLHREIFGKSKENYEQWKFWVSTDSDKVLQGTLDPMKFPSVAKQIYGFNAIDYVNTFFYGKNEKYFKSLKKECDELGVKSLVMMVDQEGMLGDLDVIKRKKSIIQHEKWLYHSAILGCHSVRINAHGKGSKRVQQDNLKESLLVLCEKAKSLGLDLIIENHGGISSNPDWLVELINSVNHPNLGTMVDFDNFNYSENKIWNGEFIYDRYEGVEKLMPFAKSVSAKSYSFNSKGEEETIDYNRMMNIIKKFKYSNHISVEYEGHGIGSLSEPEGIIATKNLIERLL